MQPKREDQRHEERYAKRNKTRSKQISTDFMRVEDIGTMPAMAPFELEARKKIAERSKTPLDGLIAAEEKKERVVELKRGNRALNVLIKEGSLTPAVGMPASKRSGRISLRGSISSPSRRSLAGPFPSDTINWLEPGIFRESSFLRDSFPMITGIRFF